MCQKTKKQHYVPQFLLRNFATKNKKSQKIFVFDKANNKSFKTSVRDVGHENYFYEATNRNKDTVEAEAVTEIVDNEGAKVINGIIKNKKISFTSQLMYDLHLFVAFQMIRVPGTRNQMDFIRESIVKKWGPEIRAEGDSVPVSEYTKEDSKFSSILFLKDAESLLQYLDSKILFLLEAPSNYNFIISDNPVVKHNYIDYSPRGSLGLNQKGIEAYLPISSKLCLHYMCPSVAEIILIADKEGHYLNMQKNGYPLLTSKDVVEFVNSRQVIYSERWLYANNLKDLSIAKEMVEEDPDLKVPASKKTISN